MSVALKSVRIVAFSAANVQNLKTVNIGETAAVAADRNIPQCIQLTAAQASVAVHPTYMASGVVYPGVKGLKAIYIAGYAGPN